MRSHGIVVALVALAAGLLTGAALISREQTADAALISRERTPAAAARSGRGGAVWGASYFPNVPLITHDGQRVRFFDDLIKDKVVLISFVYTHCPDSCPVETARLLEAARVLGDRLGDDVFFYSITIDPEHDTQPVLAEFVAKWGIPEGWKFLTGDADDILRLRKKLGVSIADVRSQDFKDHDLSLIMGNQATGRWMKRSPFENPYVVANQMGSWLHNWKTASAAQRDYADAPELRQISNGEDLFRTRCSSCHTIGKGDVFELAERRIGPDLYNVGQQRNRDWLVRWLAEPDKMLAEGDPLATALLAQYKNIPMPNLRLTAGDITQLLSYIDQESRRISSLKAAHAAGGEVAPGRDDTDRSDRDARFGAPLQPGERVPRPAPKG